MENEDKPAAMNQKIFSLGLSVETVSLYLLCCGFYDAGTSISTKNLAEVWNSSEEALMRGIQALEKRNILREIVSDQNETAVYRLTAAKDWQAG